MVYQCLLKSMFVAVDVMSSEEYGDGGKSLSINYSFFATPFGDMLIASTGKGVCRMTFADDHGEAMSSLQTEYPNARIRQAADDFQRNAMAVFSGIRHEPHAVKLHLKGTDFQIKVWKALLELPSGVFATYGDIAARVGAPRACRAVGTAVGRNPVAVIIPCHRIVPAGGGLGNYHWGKERKAAIIGWEASNRF